MNFENLPWLRSIIDLHQEYVFVIPNPSEFMFNAIKECHHEKLSKRQRRKRIDAKIHNYINNLSKKEKEDRLTAYFNTEAVLIPDDKIMLIHKKKSDYITYEELLIILLELSQGIEFVAQYGFHSFAEHKHLEFIELNDFNFSFQTEKDIKNIIKVLQILDSEHYKITSSKSFFSGCSPYYLSFLKKVKKEKHIIKDEKEYKYPDPKYFTEFTRLPQNYPDKSTRLLEELNKKLI